jgi:hypothetical protein
LLCVVVIWCGPLPRVAIVCCGSSFFALHCCYLLWLVSLALCYYCSLWCVSLTLCCYSLWFVASALCCYFKYSPQLPLCCYCLLWVVTPHLVLLLVVEVMYSTPPPPTMCRSWRLEYEVNFRKIM